MDINSLKERLASLNRGGNKSDAAIWKPKDEHDVRLVKYKHSDDPLVAVYFHNEIGDTRTVVCPLKNFGKDCVICEFAAKLGAWKDENGVDKPETTRKSDFEIFKKIQAKARIYVPMIERGKEGEGLKFWGMTENQMKQILDLCTEGDRLTAIGLKPDDTANALDVVFGEKAFDLHVSFKKPNEKGNKAGFTQVEIKGKLAPSPLAKDPAAAKELRENQRKVSELFPELPSSEVERIFKRFIGSNAAPATTTGGKEYTKPPAAAPNSKENAKLAGTRSLDDAFKEMTDEA